MAGEKLTEIGEREQLLRKLLTREAEQDPLAATPRYVLDHGRFFRPATLPAEVEPGKGLDCYLNARLLMAEHLARYRRPGWLYVEGYGLAEGWSYRHAWNASDDGAAIDQTWPSPVSKAYFGVQFDHATMEAWTNRGSLHAVLSPLEWLAVMAWRRGEKPTQPT